METDMSTIKPGYIALYRSGELERRAQALEARLSCCDICPRKCKVNRLQGATGFCHSGQLPIVSAVCAHQGEEPVISGKNGSGTVFFGNCNMRCAYCQNYQISQNCRKQKSNEMYCRTLAANMIYLQNDLKCYNINFVSPSHFVPQMVRTVLEAAAMGLRVPIVYNTNGYDSVETLKMLDGIVDIYLPDIRYADDKSAKKYSQAPDYVTHNRNAIKEMYRQVGDLVVDKHGIAQRGLIVRHLILPNDIAGSQESLTWLAQELSPSVTVSVMSQYSPQHKASQIPLLSRKISTAEYEAVLDLLFDLKMDNGWMQEMDAPDNYLPDFERKGHPFDAAAVGAIHESPSKGVPQSKKSPATRKTKAKQTPSPSDERLL